MQYRTFARTNWKVSTLSFGCMRFKDEESAIAAIRRSIELGVNYFDVSPMYGRGTAEPYLGAGLKGLREKAIVTAKSSPGNGGDGVQEEYVPETGFGVRSADQVRRQIERSMNILGVDHLDAYQLWACHGTGVFEEAIKPGGFMDGVKIAREEGLLDYIGITSHDTADNLIRYLSSGDFDVLTLPFHARDISRLEAVNYCKENGIGVIAMNPLGGGGLTKDSKVFSRVAEASGASSMVEAALRYVLSYPGVTSALSGMTYDWQVDINAEAVDKGDLPAEDRDTLGEAIREISRSVKYFCTACGYCGECPSGVNIPEVLEIYTSAIIPSMQTEAAKTLLEKADDAQFDPSSCTVCGQCESLCPNNIPISQLMEAAVVEFGKLRA